MPNLNSLFSKFNQNISLSTTKKQDLKKGRDALRKKIKDDFQDKERNNPKFCWQGSFAMKTNINTLGDKEYDIDDGVYIQGYSDKQDSEWPTTSTIHNWIKSAVDGHTSTPPKDKNTCVRVIYKNNYHIDLPAYIIKDEIIYLAHKNNGWIESDPKAFTDWFLEKVNDKGEQLRSIVKYLKAWKDYNEIDLKGITVSILVGENFYSCINRDDKSLLGTVTNIIDILEDDFKCKKPVKPNEDLFEDFSKSKKDNIIYKLKELQESLDKSINEKNEEKASEILIKQFGDRFPKGEYNIENESYSNSFIKTSNPGVIKNDGYSA